MITRLKYTELEMRNKQVNHARNLWDRAVTILPRANQFWYKYTYMEEMLNHVSGNYAIYTTRGVESSTISSINFCILGSYKRIFDKIYDCPWSESSIYIAKST